MQLKQVKNTKDIRRVLLKVTKLAVEQGFGGPLLAEWKRHSGETYISWTETHVLFCTIVGLDVKLTGCPRGESVSFKAEIGQTKPFDPPPESHPWKGGVKARSYNRSKPK